MGEVVLDGDLALRQTWPLAIHGGCVQEKWGVLSNLNNILTVSASANCNFAVSRPWTRRTRCWMLPGARPRTARQCHGSCACTLPGTVRRPRAKHDETPQEFALLLTCIHFVDAGCFQSQCIGESCTTCRRLLFLDTTPPSPTSTRPWW
jgi:hypothetical protein